MKMILFFIVLGLYSLSANARVNLIKAYYKSDMIWVQVEDTESKSLGWYSTLQVGIANTVLGCTGTNCIAKNFQIKNNSVYADIYVLFENKPSMKNVFILDLQNGNQLNPGALSVVSYQGKSVIVAHIF